MEKRSENLITEEQYNLLIEARGSFESQYSFAPKWEPIKEYLYVSDYMGIQCSDGFKDVPWFWDVNEQGLFEIEHYENLRRKHSQEAANNRSNKHQYIIDKIFIPLAVTIIGGIIVGISLVIFQH